jgi:hypothetical protein
VGLCFPDSVVGEGIGFLILSHQAVPEVPSLSSSHPKSKNNLCTPRKAGTAQGEATQSHFLHF